METELYARIYDTVRQVPFGRVTSYGEIARLAGLYRGARIVGWALRALPEGSDVPWQRIINQKAQISIVNPKVPKTLQRALLEDEGVTISEVDGWYVADRKHWWPEPEEPRLF